MGRAARYAMSVEQRELAEILWSLVCEWRDDVIAEHFGGGPLDRQCRTAARHLWHLRFHVARLSGYIDEWVDAWTTDPASSDDDLHGATYALAMIALADIREDWYAGMPFMLSLRRWLEMTRYWPALELWVSGGVASQPTTAPAAGCPRSRLPRAAKRRRREIGQAMAAIGRHGPCEVDRLAADLAITEVLARRAAELIDEMRAAGPSWTGSSGLEAAIASMRDFERTMSHLAYRSLSVEGYLQDCLLHWQ